MSHTLVTGSAWRGRPQRIEPRLLNVAAPTDLGAAASRLAGQVPGARPIWPFSLMP